MKRLRIVYRLSALASMASRAVCYLLAAAAFVGCTTTAQERVKAYNEDGIQLYRQGKYHDAAESFEAALAWDREDPGLLYNLGECYAQLGNGPKAIHYYNECLQRVPDHTACRHALVVALVRNGRRPDAIRLVQGWMQSEPDNLDAMIEDAWLWRNEGNLPNAKLRLEQVLEKEPKHDRALIELAQVYEAINRPERALVLYERSLQRNPQQPEVASRVNFILAKLKPEDRQPKPD